MLLAIEGDVAYDGPAIYLHILWDRYDPRRFFRYVDQTQSLCQRIRQHSNPTYRKHRPSLHYFILNTGNLDSAFVALACCPITDSQTQGFFKNLLEACNCLLLQAITQELLLRYLPSSIEIFGVMGLNSVRIGRSRASRSCKTLAGQVPKMPRT